MQAKQTVMLRTLGQGLLAYQKACVTPGRYHVCLNAGPSRPLPHHVPVAARTVAERPTMCTVTGPLCI